MTNNIYMVCDGDGYALTDGLQEHEAHAVAQRIANRRGETVYLSMHGSDGDEAIEPEWTDDDLVLVRSDQGDGGWSLHAPGSTEEQIAAGDAPPLASGTAEWDDEEGDWSRPGSDDYDVARIELSGR